jgi:hypothetical protein
MSTPDQKGYTPVHIAAARGRQQVVQLLRKLGAKMDVVASSLGSPAELASRAGHPAVAKKLLMYTSRCEFCQAVWKDVQLFACSRCKKTFYCSVACQKQEWTQHKKTCVAADQA